MMTATMKTLRFGIEIETVGLRRELLARAIHSVVGGSVEMEYGRLSWRVTDLGGRSWRVVSDGSLSGGETYEVDEPTLAAMDRLEGHPDFYCRSTIALTTGVSVETYLLTAGQVAGRPIIASGSWRLRQKDTRP
jgi:hypothetical protein